MRNALLLSGIVLAAATQIANGQDCPKGYAGTWSVSKDVLHRGEVPAGEFRQTFAMPRAHCHNHCSKDEGDDHDYYAQSPSPDIVLRNPRVECTSLACAFDHQSVMSDSATRLHVKAWSHSGAVTLRVTADQVRIIKTTSHDRIATGPLVFGQDVSIAMDPGPTATLGLDTPLGNATLTVADLRANRVPDWVQTTRVSAQGSRQPVYRIKIEPKDCRS